MANAKRSEVRSPKTDRRPGTDSNFQSFVILSGFGIRVSSFPRLLGWQSARKLPPVPLRQFASVRRRVPPMFVGSGLRIVERLAAHLDIDFLHLTRKATTDIARYSLIPLQIGFDLVHR